MKEIEEVLKRLKESSTWHEDSKILLEYITTLQEENERLNNINKEVEDYCKYKYDLNELYLKIQELKENRNENK